jgi:flagellar motor switch protein FliN/FliY
VSDDATPIGQDDIEKLLAQARESGPPSPPPSASAADVAGASLAQSEIEALFQQSAGAPVAAAAPPAPKPTSPPVSAAAKSAEGLLDKAQQALASVDAPSGELPPGMRPFEFRSLSGRPPSTDAATLDLLRDVQLDLKIELGRTHMQLEEVLQLKTGAVVTLDKLAGDPVDIYVNGRLIARGEVLVMNDNFCVRVAELVAGESALA